MIDIRCGASLDDPSHDQGRCQLLMGHEGAHAVMFGRCGHLEIRTWRRLGAPDAVDHVAGSEMRPWARGYPRPAWFADEEAHSAVLSGPRDGGRTRVIRMDG